MKEISPNIFMKIIEFEDKHALPRNLYIICCPERSLMIDTTYRYEHAWNAMNEMIQELNIDYKKLDLFITHNHPDHVGYVSELQDLGVKVYMSPKEADIKTDILQCYLSKDTTRYVNLQTMGLTKERYPDDYDTIVMNLSRKLIERKEPYTFSIIPVYPGDRLEYGEYSFEVINLEGHTAAQIGLYDKENNIVFSGDQLVKDTVPIVISQERDLHLLKKYINSLDEIKRKYKHSTFLPCHNGIIYNVEAEVNRILNNYQKQCEAIYKVLQRENEWMVTRDIGVKIYGGNYMARDYSKVTFCTHIWSKTYACLEYLYELEKVERKEVNGIIYWRCGKE